MQNLETRFEIKTNNEKELQKDLEEVKHYLTNTTIFYNESEHYYWIFDNQLESGKGWIENIKVSDDFKSIKCLVTYLVD